MHSAPSVSYPVGRSRNAARVLWVIWAAGACCAGAASYQFDSVDGRQALLLLCVVAAALAVRTSLAWPDGAVLVFDGQHWSLSGAASLGVVEATVTLDFQSLLLVRLSGAVTGARWLWLERRADPSRWRDLRRALCARPPSATDGAPVVAP